MPPTNFCSGFFFRSGSSVSRSSLPGPGALPGRSAGVGKSFRPTASRTYRRKKNHTQTKIHPSSQPSLADISTLQKNGHFYFALTREVHRLGHGPGAGVVQPVYSTAEAGNLTR